MDRRVTVCRAVAPLKNLRWICSFQRPDWWDRPPTAFATLAEAVALVIEEVNNFPGTAALVTTRSDESVSLAGLPKTPFALDRMWIGREIVMFMPRTASTFSYSISGKMICSVTPKLKLPAPSKPRAEMPRKSRIRGSATTIRRSRNSYIFSRRSVTLTPTG